MIDLIPTLSYVIISTFTPGPSNIASASDAVLHGYRKTLVFQGGLATGVFLIMLVSGLISNALLQVFPILEPVLRYAGAIYILYLAFVILKASYTFEETESTALGFGHGILLQILNPKLIVYAFTLFSGFLAPLTDNLPAVTLASVVLAVISFGATSLWAIFGTTIRAYLHNPVLKKIVNILLSLSLVYTAISLTGLLA